MSLDQRSRKLGARGWAFLALFVLAFLPMASGGGEESTIRSVHFVLGENEMTFEGEKTTLDGIRSRLESVSERGDTILCFAVDTQSLSLDKVDPVKGKLIRLRDELGFKNFSEIGVHPLGSYGVAPTRFNEQLVKHVTVNVDKGPTGGRLSVQYAIQAICKAANVPYQFKKSAKLADPFRRRFTAAVRIEDVMVEKALLDVLNPVGLRFDLDNNGLFLRIGGEFEKKDSKKESPEKLKVALLQRLIDRARSKATVMVPAGKYSGPIVITKPLTLSGENMENTVIELLGDEPTILVRGTKGVKIENLTVRWSPKSTDQPGEYPAAIAVRDSEATIRACRLEPIDRPQLTPSGLLATGRSNVTFTQGSTSGFAYTILFTDGARGTVSDSFLEKAGHSVVTMHAHSVVKIERNVLAGCGYHAVRNTGGTMEMVSNLVADNTRAGVYLGNKGAHGKIVNNLFTGSNGEIWGYANSDVELRNNLFLKSKNAAIGFRDTCRLKLKGNSFVGNPMGLIRYDRARTAGAVGARAEQNHYWENVKDTENFDKEAKALSGDPGFVDPDNGDFRTKRGSPLLKGRKVLAGLEDPKSIQRLWARYKKPAAASP